MTVYFDKQRDRWRYDFEHNGIRQSGTCIDPKTGKRVVSKNTALLAEQAIRQALPAPTRSRISTTTKGWIYFVLTADNTHLKIGWTKTIKARFRELQCGNHLELKLIGKRRGTIDEERRLHSQAANHRARGEWFRAAPEVLALVENELSKERSIERLSDLGILQPDGSAFPIRSPTKISTDAKPR